MELTFGIDKAEAERRILSAETKLNEYKSYLFDAINEINYLKTETEAVSSFIEYHKIQTEREKTVLGVFRHENEYGFSLNTPVPVLDAARNRLSELEIRLKDYIDREDKLNKKIAFLEKDIQLLKGMLKSAPRSKFLELAVGPII